jgi:hypothetical protein
MNENKQMVDFLVSRIVGSETSFAKGVVTVSASNDNDSIEITDIIGMTIIGIDTYGRMHLGLVQADGRYSELPLVYNLITFKWSVHT